MSVTQATVFEFETLDQLWARVKDLKSGVHLDCRRRDQMAQGAILEIRSDRRFDPFQVYSARHTKSGQRSDLTIFTIYRKSTR